jgi:nitrogen fixation protein FixH
MNRCCDSAGLLLQTLAEKEMRAELEKARKRIGDLASKEVALSRKVDELQKRKMFLTERDSFRIRELLSNGVWRFWWIWVPLSLIPVWIFD